jgi:hypothetical protein
MMNRVISNDNGLQYTVRNRAIPVTSKHLISSIVEIVCQIFGVTHSLQIFNTGWRQSKFLKSRGQAFTFTVRATPVRIQ